MTLDRLNGAIRKPGQIVEPAENLRSRSFHLCQSW